MFYISINKKYFYVHYNCNEVKLTQDNFTCKLDAILETEDELLSYYKKNIREPELSMGFSRDMSDLEIKIYEIWNMYKDII